MREGVQPEKKPRDRGNWGSLHKGEFLKGALYCNYRFSSTLKDQHHEYYSLYKPWSSFHLARAFLISSGMPVQQATFGVLKPQDPQRPLAWPRLGTWMCTGQEVHHKPDVAVVLQLLLRPAAKMNNTQCKYLYLLNHFLLNEHLKLWVAFFFFFLMR